MSTTTARPRETRTSICEICDHAIEITIIVGEQRWDEVRWAHLERAGDGFHAPRPETRVAVDATCPNCKYPEIGYSFTSGDFVCSRCDHAQHDRPTS